MCHVPVSQILKHGGRYTTSQFGFIVKSSVKQICNICISVDSVVKYQKRVSLACYCVASFLANVNSICYRPSVCLSSVTFVHPTQAIEIFSNVSPPLGTLAIY